MSQILLLACGLCKCSAQVTLRKSLCASVIAQVLCASCSVQVSTSLPASALRKFLWASCDFPAGAVRVHFQYYFGLRILLSYLRVTAFACEAHPRTRGDRGASNPRPAGPGSRRASHETTRRASTAENAKKLKFLQLDHADPGRGSREHRRKHK